MAYYQKKWLEDQKKWLEGIDKILKKLTNEQNHYPLPKNHPCFPTGHAMYKVAEHNNGVSYWGQHKCSRCGYSEEYQFDYVVNHNSI